MFTFVGNGDSRQHGIKFVGALPAAVIDTTRFDQLLLSLRLVGGSRGSIHLSIFWYCWFARVSSLLTIHLLLVLSMQQASFFVASKLVCDAGFDLECSILYLLLAVPEISVCLVTFLVSFTHQGVPLGVS